MISLYFIPVRAVQEIFHGEKPDKERSTEKIDAIVAAVMAVGRMQAGGQGDKLVAAARPSEVSRALSCSARNVRLIEKYSHDFRHFYEALVCAIIPFMEPFYSDHRATDLRAFFSRAGMVGATSQLVHKLEKTLPARGTIARVPCLRLENERKD